MGAVPAVVVGAHADERVGDLSFAEELAFGDGGHVDDGDGGGGGEGAVEEGLGARGELGSFWWGGRVGVSGDGFWFWLSSSKGGDGGGVPMQMTVPALCAVTESPWRTPGWLMARWAALERAMSKGSAMLTWPTMPFSKKVKGRT